ncbi:TetR/AcrR family transcriptional regulator [Staphylospora marina]|uniref:TetR/AcrR family transcriptional regulator n=1 Tax=Staphylospora marina TaxID=2490858 RepID=UPI000F5C1424|nr:TetR/AcrR family transcriptional regulator [Staphylospora marina]
MKDHHGGRKKQSFIAEARRAQIIEAAIHTLDEIGYVNASLAQIAKRAGISTALISYHFQDKNDLMNHTLATLIEEETRYVAERLAAAKTPRERLHAYIEACLAYQGTHPKRIYALIEIIFHARTPDQVPYYKLEDDDEEPLVSVLKEILITGQKAGEFRAFNVPVTAAALRAAIWEYAANKTLSEQIDLETYSAELIQIFDRVILNPDKAGQ